MLYKKTIALLLQLNIEKNRRLVYNKNTIEWKNGGIYEKTIALLIFEHFDARAHCMRWRRDVVRGHDAR